MNADADRDVGADDWLDRALREHGREAEGYLDDGGFTARVMAALPAPSALPAWRKPAIALLWTGAAAAAAFALPGAFDDLVRGALGFATHPVSLQQIVVGVAAVGAAMWSLVAWTARNA